METQKSIRDWAVSAFGRAAHPRTIAIRALQEMAELVKAMDEYDYDGPEVQDEIADVSICLLYLAESIESDLDKLVDRKMEINRSREWAAEALRKQMEASEGDLPKAG
jgi:NTP pyrophosphatase (non-canonical NTP hydrolase)